jgi:hypothetical protein
MNTCLRCLTYSIKFALIGLFRLRVKNGERAINTERINTNPVKNQARTFEFDLFLLPSSDIFPQNIL